MWIKNKIKFIFIYILKIINIVFKFFRKMYYIIVKKNKEKLFTLTPKKLDDENVQQYIRKIDQLLENDDCKNISLVGGYGSGKSSIIKTYLLKRPTVAIQSMIITIGSYIDEEIEDSKGNVNKTEINTNKEIEGNDGNLNYSEKSIANRVEVSILKQMIYRKKDLKFPKSTLIRLNKIGIFKTLVYVFFILYTIIFFYVNYLRYFKKIEINFLEILKKISLFNFSKLFDIYNLFGFVILILFLRIIYVITYYVLNKVKISKIKIRDTEIDLQNNSSIFSRYLSEIIYYFQITKINLVIFEDLDRFQNDVSLKVIEELKELNQILNTSYGIKKVVFMYLLKDDLFRSMEDKNKFFDYNLSILPISSFFNSKLNINSLLISNNIISEISPNLIELVSKYLFDMRSIINVINDYCLFKQITSTQNYDKLFAMMVFKNYYFKDYNLLHTSSNIIKTEFDTIEGKRIELLKEIDEKITNKSHDIKILKKEMFDNKNDLKHVLLSNAQCEINKIYPNDKITRININNLGDYTLNHFFDEELNIDAFENSNIQFITNNNRTIQEENIFSYFGSKKEFINRYRKINNLNQINIFSEELSKYNEDKNIINKDDINAIFKKYLYMKNEKNEQISNSTEKKNDEQKLELLYELIAEGYISTDYLDYITAPVIYSNDNKLESLTASDNVYLMNIRQEKKSYDIKLNGFNMIINEILNRLTSPYVLNYDLFRYLIDNDKNDILNKIFMQFNSFNVDNLKFLMDYLKMNDNHVDTIFNLLFINKFDIWKGYVENFNFISKKDGLFLMKKIIQVSNYVDIIDDKDSLRKYIETFIYDIQDEINDYLNSNIVKKNFLIIKPRINNITIFDELNYEFIYRNELYSFSDLNIRKICNGIIFDVSKLKRRKNMYFLYEYIKRNLNDFCNEYYLDHNTIFNEKTVALKIFLDKNVSFEVKKILLEREKFTINSFDDISSIYYDNIVIYKHVKPLWRNIMYLYKKIDIDNLFNCVIDNENKLFKQKIPNDMDINLFDTFYRELIKYVIKKHSTLTEKIVQFHYVLFKDVRNFTCEEIGLLIKYGCVDYNKVNYKYICDVMSINEKTNYIKQFYESNRSTISKFLNIVSVSDIDALLLNSDIDINNKINIIYALYKKNNKNDAELAIDELILRFNKIFQKNRWYDIIYSSTFYNKLIKVLVNYKSIKKVKKEKNIISFKL